MVQLAALNYTALCNRIRIAQRSDPWVADTHLQLNDHRGTFPNLEVLAITF